MFNTAEFLKSSSLIEECPQDNKPEFAFIGRSNVGKSSLINALVNRKELAKTSSKPGKTKLINHFIIDENWYLVDLPGYGYARVSKTAKKTFQKYITNYFSERTQLMCAFVLVDIRLEAQKIDLEFMRWMGTSEIPFCIIFTKADKIGPQVITRQVLDYEKKLLEDGWESMPQHFVTSSAAHQGREDLLAYIDDINKSFYAQKR